MSLLFQRGSPYPQLAPYLSDPSFYKTPTSKVSSPIHSYNSLLAILADIHSVLLWLLMGLV
jgi:hypothetical protein